MTLNQIQCHRNLRNARRDQSFLQTFQAPLVAHFAVRRCFARRQISGSFLCREDSFAPNSWAPPNRRSQSEPLCAVVHPKPAVQHRHRLQFPLRCLRSLLFVKIRVIRVEPFHQLSIKKARDSAYSAKSRFKILCVLCDLCGSSTSARPARHQPLTLTCPADTILSCPSTCLRSEKHDNNVSALRNHFQIKNGKTQKHAPTQNHSNSAPPPDTIAPPARPTGKSLTLKEGTNGILHLRDQPEWHIRSYPNPASQH